MAAYQPTRPDPMNKAFTKESDYDPTLDVVARPRNPLPAGVKNYITPSGASVLRAELRQVGEARTELLQQIRQLAARGLEEDDARRDAKRRLRQVEGHSAWLEERVASLEVVEVATGDDDRVRFGAEVTVSDEEGIERTWRIVGVDEADPSSGEISWISPIARALLAKEVGDEVEVRLPRGRTRLEILQVDYRSR